MKSITKCILIVLCITLLSTTQLFGQEWSEEQKEVWKNVETYWDLGVKEDLEGIMGYFHDDFIGWSNRRALPNNKASRRKSMSHSFETTTVLIQELQPVAINIHGNVAIVHYYYSELSKDVEGKENNASGRWTDILMKEGDKWLLIADHGGSTAD